MNTGQNRTSAIEVRVAYERGHTLLNWLDSHHTFSFSEYYDPAHMGFRSLRVINEDIVEPGRGFDLHQHKDMEIISYVIEGQLEHKDNLGNGFVIEEGDFQKMSAGTGVVHSEFNPSKEQKVHFLQIWILPRERGLKPSYQELKGRDIKGRRGLTLVASGAAKRGVIRVEQDVLIYKGVLGPQERIDYNLKEGRGAWIQMIKGRMEVNAEKLFAGDGISLEHEDQVWAQASEESEFLLFDLK